MSDEDKLMQLFTLIHGKIASCNCYTNIVYDRDNLPCAVEVLKDGNLCWEATKEELVFQYITKDFTE